MTFWEKAQLLSAFATFTKSARDAAPRSPSDIVASFGAPALKVQNVEAHRAELVSKWLERAKAFVQAAQTATVPLALTDCQPPAEIRQQTRSLDEVVLTLPFNCKVEAFPERK